MSREKLGVGVEVGTLTHIGIGREDWGPWMGGGTVGHGAGQDLRS